MIWYLIALLILDFSSRGDFILQGGQKWCEHLGTQWLLIIFDIKLIYIAQYT